MIDEAVMNRGVMFIGEPSAYACAATPSAWNVACRMVEAEVASLEETKRWHSPCQPPKGGRGYRSQSHVTHRANVGS